MTAAVVGIVGPTGVGKSRLALEVALATGAEIVNADSRQVYRRLDIGTAKPTPEERARVPHHLYDFVEPAEPFTLAHYLRSARAVLADIAARRGAALIVGGTGLYVHALRRGYEPPAVAPDPALRRRLEGLPLAELQRLLAERDPAALGRVDRRNPRRLIRAIEVATSATVPAAPGAGPAAGEAHAPGPALPGRRHSALRTAFPLVGLTMPREELYRRIDVRAACMWESGWVRETQDLLAEGYSPSLPALSALGYPEVIACVRREIDPEEALRRIQLAGHRLARRQYAWFKPGDPDIAWHDVSTPEGWASARRALTDLLAG
ncbi:MAG: tRNA (adenosine(37)-N6)-dimethylallyltransferase MiaA [Chloroflexi bacterium]|nr:tRNA (adenosine(37)-N6)-dimethylallyltransferase MiaA [Chloroflexota bacterium]